MLILPKRPMSLTFRAHIELFYSDTEKEWCSRHLLIPVFLYMANTKVWDKVVQIQYLAPPYAKPPLLSLPSALNPIWDLQFPFHKHVWLTTHCTSHWVGAGYSKLYKSWGIALEEMTALWERQTGCQIITTACDTWGVVVCYSCTKNRHMNRSEPLPPGYVNIYHFH